MPVCTVSLCVDSPSTAMETHSELTAGLWIHSLGGTWPGIEAASELPFPVGKSQVKRKMFCISPLL